MSRWRRKVLDDLPPKNWKNILGGAVQYDQLENLKASDI
jgi:hypothetical protein